MATKRITQNTTQGSAKRIGSDFLNALEEDVINRQKERTNKIKKALDEMPNAMDMTDQILRNQGVDYKKILGLERNTLPKETEDKVKKGLRDMPNAMDMADNALMKKGVDYKKIIDGKPKPLSERELAFKTASPQAYSLLKGAVNIGDKLLNNPLVEDLETISASAEDSLSMGMIPRFREKFHPDTYKRQQQLKQENPIASTIGTVAGYMVPGTLATKGASTLAKPLLRGMTSKVGKLALTEGLAGLGMGATEGIMRGESLKDTGQRTLDYGLGGFVGAGVLGAGGKLLSKGKQLATKSLSKAIRQLKPATSNISDDVARATKKLKTKNIKLSDNTKAKTFKPKPNKELSNKNNRLYAHNIKKRLYDSSLDKTVDNLESDLDLYFEPPKSKNKQFHVSPRLQSQPDLQRIKMEYYKNNNIPEYVAKQRTKKPNIKTKTLKYNTGNNAVNQTNKLPESKTSYAKSLKSNIESSTSSNTMKRTNQVYNDIKSKQTESIKYQPKQKNIEIPTAEIKRRINNYKNMDVNKLPDDIKELEKISKTLKEAGKKGMIQTPEANMTAKQKRLMKQAQKSGMVPVNLQLFGQKVQDKIKRLKSQFATNTLTRSKIIPNEIKQKLKFEEFDYIQETKKEWQDKAIDNIMKNRDKIINDIKNSKSISGGVQAHESAIITSQLVDEANKTGNVTKLKSWLTAVTEKTRETARALKGTDTAWDKLSPESTLTKAQRVINKVDNELVKNNPKLNNKIKGQTKSVNKAVKKGTKKAINKIVRDIEKNIDKILNKTKSKTKSINNQPYNKLARRIINTIDNRHKSKEKDVVKEMVNELYTKFKETLPENFPKKPKANKIQELAQAIINRQVSSDAWIKSKEVVKNKFKNDKTALAILDDYFGKGTKPPFSEITLNRAFNQGMDSIRANMKDVVRNYYEKGFQTKQKLLDYIIQNTGLKNDEANAISNYISKRFKDLRKQYSEEYLYNVFKPKGKSVPKNNLKDIKSMINSGILKNNKYLDSAFKKINPKLKTYFNNALKERGITLTDLVKSGVKETEFSKHEIVKKLIDDLKINKTDVFKTNNLKISDKDAGIIASSLKEIINDLVDERRTKILTNKLSPRQSKQVKTIIDKVKELIDLDAYNNETVRDLIKAKEGLPILSDTDVKSVLESMDKVQKLPKGSYEQRVEIAKVNKLIADKIPPTLKDKIRGLQRISLISSPKTILVRNPLGNMILGTFENIKDAPGTAVDILTSKTLGSKRTTAFMPVKKTKAQLQGVMKGLKEWGKDFKLGVDTSPTITQYELPKGRVFKSNLLNKIDLFERKLLQLGDRPFYEGAYKSRIQELKKINKTNKVTDEIIEDAKLYALDRVFQNNSELSKKARQIKDSLGILGDIVLPFTQTPANVLDKLIDYSPAGLAKGLYELGKISKGTFNQKVFVDRVARSLTGGGLAMLGYIMADKELVTGERDSKKRVRDFDRAVGKQDYSFKIGDKYYSFDWAQPVAGALALGVDFHKGSKGNKNKFTSFINGLKNAGDTLFSQSLFRGVLNLMSGYSPMTGLSNTLLGSTSQLNPTIVKQITQLLDDNVRETYDPNVFIQAKNRFISRLPLMSKTLPIKRDIFGKEIKQYQGKNNIFNVMFNPGFVTEFKPNKIQKELIRLYEETGESGIFPPVADKEIKITNPKTKETKSYQLNTTEYVYYQKLIGQYIERVFKEAMESRQYKIAEKAQKARALASLVREAKTKAQEKLIKEKFR